MPRTLNRLVPAQVKGLRKPGRYPDGGNLYLQVTTEQARSWLFIYKSPTRDKQREMGLGSLNSVSLAAARERAAELRKLLTAGIDPIDQREAGQRAAKLKAAKNLTFLDCAQRYMASRKAQWKNAAHHQQWHSAFHVTHRGKREYPAHTGPINDLPVAAIETAHVLQCLQPIWHRLPETASRIRGRIEAVLDWAKVSGFRTGDNPARWRGHLDVLLPKRSDVRAVKNQPSLPYADVPAFMQKLCERTSVSAKALAFLTLTAMRSGAVIGAEWSEFDLVNKVWTVPPRPGTKIRDGKPRRVPLSDPEIAILESLPREQDNNYVFIGGNVGFGLSEAAMLEVMKDVAPGYVPHGLRSSFRDWASECTAYESIVPEAQLFHVVADKVERAYRRGDLFEKRRGLMRDWARFCMTTPETLKISKIIALRHRRGRA